MERHSALQSVHWMLSSLLRMHPFLPQMLHQTVHL